MITVSKIWIYAYLWNQPGLIQIRTSYRFCVPYGTFRRSFKEKCPPSGAKTQWTPARLFYVDIGTHCCVFITLLQERIAAIHNSYIKGPLLKNNSLSCWKYVLHQWFSTFFSTGPHYGPSASLTGRRHFIYILRHQYKPTRFIILFVA